MFVLDEANPDIEMFFFANHKELIGCLTPKEICQFRKSLVVLSCFKRHNVELLNIIGLA